MRRFAVALLLACALLGVIPAHAAPLPPGIVSPGVCFVRTDMQLQWLGSLYVNYHSRTRTPGYNHIPGGITPATVRLQGGVGNVQLTPAWIDYVERVNGRNAQLIKYLFHRNSGWQNSATYGRVENVAMEGQPLTVLGISGLRAYIQTYHINELQPLSVIPSNWRIQAFTIVTRDDTLIFAPPGPAKIILMARRGESLWIPVNYLTCASRLPKSVTITAAPALTLRECAAITCARVGSLLRGAVATIQETTISGADVWGRVDGGWLALRYNGANYTDWQMVVQ